MTSPRKSAAREEAKDAKPEGASSPNDEPKKRTPTVRGKAEEAARLKRLKDAWFYD